MSLQPKSIEEIQAIVREGKPLLVRGHATKPALSASAPGVEILDMSALSGILEYQPEEYTFTALAGTSIGLVESAIAEKGQYLPFDPPLVQKGATLGGTVAAGLSGPNRFHHGGIRDFLLGVRFVDGFGQSVSGGGKVVKNAAGFDLPKLMVGSLGTYGVMVELAFKVLPRPAVFQTLLLTCPDLGAALNKMSLASTARLDLEAIDVVPGENHSLVCVRLSGLEATLPARLARLEALVGEGEILSGPEEAVYWRQAVEFEWVPEEASLIKIAVTPGRLLALDVQLAALGGRRRYSAGGQLAWVSFDEIPSLLDELVCSHGLNGLVLWGQTGAVRLGEKKGSLFHQRLKSVLDPKHIFGEA